ncbi:MAG: hypothetical protein K2U26_18005, partial [Cyclobacteriaceae bacterium]|nr:hypothetical protein [Cyclobacteriaceae bacterium]
MSGQDLTGPANFCTPGSGTYTFLDPGIPINSYRWYVDGNLLEGIEVASTNISWTGDAFLFVESYYNGIFVSSAGKPIVFKKAGSISSNNYVVCPGQVVTLTRSGGLGTSFSWLARPASPPGQAWTTFATGTGSTNLSVNYTVNQTTEFKVTMNDCGAAAAYYESVIIPVNASYVTGGTIANSFAGSLICNSQDPGVISNNEGPYGGNYSYTYQWEQNFGSGWTSIPLTNSLNFSPGPLYGNVSFRRRVSTPCGDVNYSNAVSFAVRPALNPQVNTTIFSQQICSGTTINLTSNPATGG